ncbi:Protein HYPER-SENSITIVITY-RELATED 4 [Sarracenia purpurea var. burkii]
MDWETKRAIMEDLERFVKRKKQYRKVGKEWKCGYLLFGPLGSRKSSLIAAMANYLNFDVCDLELTDLRSNSELRNLVISMVNKSILVVERRWQHPWFRSGGLAIEEERQIRADRVLKLGLRV